MAAPWKLVVRRGPKVAKARHASLGEALDALEAALTGVPVRAPVSTALGREYAPGEQVAARGELRGPRRAVGGIDVRGDGTTVAWTGRLSKQLVEPRPHETTAAALGRELAGAADEPWPEAGARP